MRLVIARVATYEEIRRYWDLLEVAEANELLDIKEDAEYEATKGGNG
jgi:hypothetical protein